MKIRNGFVSNSSASSFTIYGWTSSELSNHIASLCPALTGIEIIVNEYEFVRNIQNHWLGESWDIVYAINEKDEMVFGLGETEDGIDHYMTSYERWEDYECDEPTDEQKKEFDEIVKKLNLPIPSIHKATFYNG